MPVIAGHARVTLFTTFDARIFGEVFTCPPRNGEEQILFVDELIARIIGRRVNASVHANGVARTGFNTEATEDAAQFVDHEALGVTLKAFPLLVSAVITCLNMNALRGAGGGATQARHTAG